MVQQNEIVLDKPMQVKPGSMKKLMKKLKEKYQMKMKRKLQANNEL